VGKTAVDIADVVLTVAGEAYDGAQYVQGAEINSYIASSPVSSVVDLEATLSTGTAVVTLTAGDTAGLIEGQVLIATSGTGEFGTNWDGSAAYIVSIDGPAQVTLSTDHSVAGAVVFNSLGLHPTALAFANTSSDGRLRRRLRLRENGAVSVGPDAGDFDGANHTGQLQVISMTPANHDFNLGALAVRTTFDGQQGQEITFTRARGTIEQGGIVYAPSAVLTGDELGSIGFYGFYEPNPGADSLETARIIAEVTGTVTSSAIPGKLRLQTANASGTVADVLSLTSTKATVSSTQTLFPAGTASIPSITFTGEGALDSGIWTAGDGIICVSINGTEKVRVDSGGMRVPGFMKVGGFATVSLPSPPEAGMIVLDGTTFKGYNGTAWVNLN
jgi:hypothetical protein